MGKWKNYTILIGHRRLAAAKLPGITQLPCRIEEGMDEREQVLTMLEEEVPKQIVLPKDDRLMYYLVYFRHLLVVVKVPKRDRAMSPMEQEEKRRAKAV